MIMWKSATMGGGGRWWRGGGGGESIVAFLYIIQKQTIPPTQNICITTLKLNTKCDHRIKTIAIQKANPNITILKISERIMRATCGVHQKKM